MKAYRTLIAAAALGALSACSSGSDEAADNIVAENVVIEENLDAGLNADLNATVDANTVAANVADANAVDANAVDANSTNAQ